MSRILALLLVSCAASPPRGAAQTITYFGAADVCPASPAGGPCTLGSALPLDCGGAVLTPPAFPADAAASVCFIQLSVSLLLVNGSALSCAPLGCQLWISTPADVTLAAGSITVRGGALSTGARARA